MAEEWRPIPGYEGLYEASSLGRVRNLKGRVLRCAHVGQWGYRQTSLYRRGEGAKPFKVHRLICLAFHPRIEGKNHINHIDGDKLNNRADNLEWLSKRENEEHAGRLGRHHAITNPKRGWKLSVQDVADIRRRYAEGETSTKLNREYGVSNGYVSRLLRGIQRVLG